MMENNVATVATTSVAVEADLTHPSTINQAKQLISDMVGKGGKVLGSTGGPHMGQNRKDFPYGLPLNYTPPNVVYMPNKNANHFVPIEG